MTTKTPRLRLVESDERPILDELSIPVHAIGRLIHGSKHVLSRRAIHLIVGLIFMLVGSTLAHFAHGVESPGAILLDTFAYGIHGFGLAPIVKVIADIVGLEV